jgi:hypothetical protein
MERMPRPTHVRVTRKLTSDGDGTPPIGLYEVVSSDPCKQGCDDGAIHGIGQRDIVCPACNGYGWSGHIQAKHTTVVWLLAQGEFEPIPLGREGAVHRQGAASR